MKYLKQALNAEKMNGKQFKNSRGMANTLLDGTLYHFHKIKKELLKGYPHLK